MACKRPTFSAAYVCPARDVPPGRHICFFFRENRLLLHQAESRRLDHYLSFCHFCCCSTELWYHASQGPTILRIALRANYRVFPTWHRSPSANIRLGTTRRKLVARTGQLFIKRKMSAYRSAGRALFKNRKHASVQLDGVRCCGAAWIQYAAFSVDDSAGCWLPPKARERERSQPASQPASPPTRSASQLAGQPASRPASQNGQPSWPSGQVGRPASQPVVASTGSKFTDGGKSQNVAEPGTSCR